MSKQMKYCEENVYINEYEYQKTMFLIGAKSSNKVLHR